MQDNTQSKAERLSRDLLTLNDDFSELNACIAFFCEAATSININRDYCLDDASAEGLRIIAQQVKERSATLKVQVEGVWKLASSRDRH